MRLKDKVAIITGGGTGLGRAYALRFAAEGAKVTVAARNLARLEAVVKEIEAKGGEALAVQIDISDEASTQEMAKRTAERFGKIDILVNNAAYYAELSAISWDDWTVEEWERNFTVTVMGGWLCAKAVFPYMKAQGKGKIVNISSTVADAGLDLLMPYSSCKGGVNAATRAMASALGEHNINVNCVAPGYVLTSASLEMSSHTEKGDKFQASLRTLKRDAHEEDLVGGVLFFASDDSDFITGQIMAVDGGGVFR
jgi:NAD(P)-dependent dehydrogenase (short-subunit alcohol dehydrogenase family)